MGADGFSLANFRAEVQISGVFKIQDATCLVFSFFQPSVTIPSSVRSKSVSLHLGRMFLHP